MRLENNLPAYEDSDSREGSFEALAMKTVERKFEVARAQRLLRRHQVKISIILLCLGFIFGAMVSTKSQKSRRRWVYHGLGWGRPSPLLPSDEAQTLSSSILRFGFPPQSGKTNCYAWWCVSCAVTKNDRLSCCADNSFPALAGVDVVSYFQIPTGSPAIAGSSDISYAVKTSYGEFIFYFSTEQNRDLFSQNPWSYIPQMGGFDANALAGGMGYENTFDEIPREMLGPIVDVNQWAIIHDKLFLFGNTMSVEGFKTERDILVPTSELKWNAWFDGPHSQPDTVLNTRCIIPANVPEFAPIL